MASIFKRPGSSVWWCQYYRPGPDGRPVKVRKSTGTPSEKAAKQRATALEKAGLAAVMAGGDKAKRALAVLERAVLDVERETFSVEKARAYLAEMLRIATGEDLPAFTVATWLDEWLRRKATKASPATMERYRASVKAFCGWLGERADKPLEAITTADLRNFRDSLAEAGRAGRTLNFRIRDIGSAYRAAMREGLVLRNPASALDAVPTDDTVERQPFTREEIVKLLGAAGSRDWRGAILTGVYSGLRLGDVARMKWGAVDLADGLLKVRPGKTQRLKREIAIPLHLELRAFFEDHPIADDPEASVFPTLARLPISGNGGLSQGFVRIMNEAGVSRGLVRAMPQVPEGAKRDRTRGRRVHQRGFHALRHTYGAWLTNAGVPEDQRMLLAGHADKTVHRGYSHHELALLATAIAKLPALADNPNHRNPSDEPQESETPADGGPCGRIATGSRACV